MNAEQLQFIRSCIPNFEEIPRESYHFYITRLGGLQRYLLRHGTPEFQSTIEEILTKTNELLTTLKSNLEKSSNA